MEYVIVYDTETTGFPLREVTAGLADPRQPHPVQIAATCINLDNGIKFARFNTLITWDGWTCDERALAVHGKTEGLCKKEGMAEKDALWLLVGLSSGAKYRAAHNAEFDEKIIAISLARYGDPELYVSWAQAKVYCTMRASSAIVKCPPTANMKARGMGGMYKLPSLAESYRHFTDSEIENAHDAMADVDACATVFWHLHKEGLVDASS